MDSCVKAEEQKAAELELIYSRKQYGTRKSQSKFLTEIYVLYVSLPSKTS